MWLIKHWKAAFGLLALVPPASKAVWEAVGVAGNIDFLVTHTHDLGWIGDVIGWLLNPPGWSIFPLILLGLGLIRWDVHRRHSAPPVVVSSLPQNPEPARAIPRSADPVRETKPSISAQKPESPVAADAEPRSIRLDAYQLLPGWEKLYIIQEDRGIELAFSPDTKESRKDTFALLLYAYSVLYGEDKVSSNRIYSDMNRNFDKMWKRFQNQQASIFEFIGSMNRKDWGQECVDAGLATRIDLVQ